MERGKRKWRHSNTEQEPALPQYFKGKYRNLIMKGEAFNLLRVTCYYLLLKSQEFLTIPHLEQNYKQTHLVPRDKCHMVPCNKQIQKIRTGVKFMIFVSLPQQAPLVTSVSQWIIQDNSYAPMGQKPEKNRHSYCCSIMYLQLWMPAPLFLPCSSAEPYLRVWEEGTEYVCQPSILSIYCNCLWVFNFEIFVLNLQMLVMFHYEVGGLFLNKL